MGRQTTAGSLARNEMRDGDARVRRIKRRERDVRTWLEGPVLHGIHGLCNRNGGRARRHENAERL